MPKLEDIFSAMNKAVGMMDSASMVARDIAEVGHAYTERQKAKESGQISRLKQEIEVYNKKYRRLVWCCLAIWIMLIVITIIFCITGNDVVLRFLHI